MWQKEWMEDRGIPGSYGHSPPGYEKTSKFPGFPGPIRQMGFAQTPIKVVSKMKISDHLVQLKEKDDLDFLKKPAFAVNLRLFKSSHSYRKIILEIVRYMDEHLNSDFEDYDTPKGVSAPALGIPYRIIGYKLANSSQGINQFCINPVIYNFSVLRREVTTNCGTLQFAEKKKITRANVFDFDFYDLECNLVQKKTVASHEGGFTIQHEMDQLDGITIEDRAKEFEDQKSKKEEDVVI